MNLSAPLVVSVGLLFASLAQAGGLEVENAWVRQPPPGANAAAYLTITNRGEVARTLVGVRSSAAKRVELHESKVVDGVARMGAVGPVEIEPGKTVTFAPRGLHVMLTRPQPMKIGESVTLVFELADGATLDVVAKVRKGPPPLRGEHQHHH
ncbi:MAG: copper chaperone PCu(A)C [bacterium]|nr:copper chaperone PCu(A)C [bacterium]